MSIVPAALLISEIITAMPVHFGKLESEAIAYRILDLEFDCSKLDVYMGKEISKPDNWLSILSRLQSGEPFQYVFGKAFFRSSIFEVTANTLIPRPETSELVDLVLDKIPTWKTNPTILDVGTGTGCIPISIKMECPHTHISAWDISLDALDIAKRNAEKHNSEVKFHQKDLFKWAETTEFWDIIVSNPPYVLEEEAAQMEKHVLDFEPHLALFVPNEDPLKYYKALADFAWYNLHPGGWLIVEINRAFGQETMNMFQMKEFKDLTLINDFRSNPRFIVGSR
jgi:release factor glutamine methyltransferase